MINFGNPLRVIRDVLGRDGLEQTGPNDFVDLLVGDRFDIGGQTLEALF